jgi:hypothetical protein
MQRMPLDTLLHPELLAYFVRAKRDADFRDPFDMFYMPPKPIYLSYFPKLESLEVNVAFLSDRNPVPLGVSMLQQPGWGCRNACEHKCLGRKVEVMVHVLEQCERVVDVKRMSVKVYCEGCRKKGVLGQQGGMDGRMLVGLEEPGCSCESRLQAVLEKLLENEVAEEVEEEVEEEAVYLI